MKLLQSKLSKYTVPQEAKAAGVYPYFRAISSEQDPEVIIDGKKVLMFGSNCYTGLVNDPRIKEAAIEATRKYGTGCAGSPFLNGTLDLHKKLEQRIAEYIGKEDVMIYSTGFGEPRRCQCPHRSRRLYPMGRPRPRFHHRRSPSIIQ